MSSLEKQPTNILNYRPDIDGLRAIAVSAVVIYHAFPAYAKGGFVGVDIFFVISGYLISSIVLKGSAQGSFSLLEFYSRRIRRILPALLTMLSACLLAGWLLLFPDELLQLGKHILSASFFVSNFVFLSEAGYFDTASELKPLLHLWSLSIEEQFYAFWPLLLLFFYRKGRPLFAASVLLALSFTLCASGLVGKTANFYLPFTRVWELLCGAVLAATPIHFVPRSKWLLEIQSAIGIALLGWSIFLLNHTITFPGYATVLPTMGAVLLIAAGPTTLINRFLLGNRIFVFVGLISYSLYLWHWPFLSFPKITNGLELPESIRLVAICAALSCAILTYYLIEKPLRHRGGKTSLGLLIAALCIAAVSALFFRGILQPHQSGILFQKIADAKNDHSMSPAFPGSYNVRLGQHDYIGLGNGKKVTLFAGDSNMAQYWPGVKAAQEKLEGSRRALLGGCKLPIPGVLLLGDEQDCPSMNRHVYDLAIHDPDVDTLVLAAFWGAGNYRYVEAGKQFPLDTPEGIKKFTDEWVKNILAITQQGKKVFILLTIPYGSEFEPHELIHRSMSGFSLAPRLQGGITLEEHRKRTEFFSVLIKEVARRSGAIVLDPASFLCDTSWCSAITPEGDPIYRDMNHLRGSFMFTHSQFISQTLLQ